MAQQTQTRTRRAAASTAKRTVTAKRGSTAQRTATARRTAPAKRAPAKRATAAKPPAKRTTVSKARTTGVATTGRGRPARNQTPNTPDLYEGRLTRMRVDELRQMARKEEIAGSSTMRKNDLVKALAKSYGTTKKPAGAKKTVAAKKAPSAKRAAPAKKAAGAKKAISAKKAAAAKKTVTVKRAAPAKKGAAAKRAAPAKKGAAAKKAAPAKKGAAAKKAPAAKKVAPAKKGAGAKKTIGAKTATGTKKAAAPKKSIGAGRQGGAGTEGIRRGSSSSRSLKYAQVIRSTEDKPDHAGRSLVTTNHDVIRRWAEQRKGTPATVEGTQQRETVAVLRFDFPWGGRDSRLRPISWDEWFKAFDQRGLNFIYQEQTSNGRQSNFFVLENPSREDG